MKEIVKTEEVLDMISIDNIKTLEQADEILAMCNALDSDVLETYVQNAITRGAVYDKLTLVPNDEGTGGLGLLNEEVGARYNTSHVTVGKYKNIFENRGILRLNSASCNSGYIELKPTLTSLLDTIAKDSDIVECKIKAKLLSGSHARFSEDTAMVISSYLDNTDEHTRYLFSKNKRVSYGFLAKAIKEGDFEKANKIISLNGSPIGETSHNSKTKELERQISELIEENEMLKRRNKFLVDSFKLSEVKRFLNRAIKNKGVLKRYKPELEEAFNLLGVDVSIDEIKLKKVYKEKVSVYHSDITGDDEMFRKIIEANKLVKEFIKGL